MTYHAGQIEILRTARRFNSAACGRRFGKTAMALTFTALGWPGCLQGIAQRYDVGWFAPTYKLLDEAWRAAKAAYGAQGLIVRSDAQQHRLEMANGGALDFWTLDDDDAGRGRKYGLVIVDEAAMARRLEQVWTAAIRPTLTDYRGGAWFFSTPKGRNFFYQLTLRPGVDEEWAHHHAPTAANPYIAADEIEAARRSLPERVFAQEYEAIFLEDGGGVFRNVTACIAADAYPFEFDPGDGRAYVIGVDWGRHNDFTVITVLDAREKRVVAVDRFNKIEYAFQLARLKALHARFARAPIMAESNSMGEPLIEQLRRDGLPIRGFQTTSASKAGIIEALAIAFERGEITIPSDKALIEELMAFDQERMPSGAIRYGAPQGQHDDMVMSLAIAWHGLMYAHATPNYTKGGLSRLNQAAL